MQEAFKQRHERALTFLIISVQAEPAGIALLGVADGLAGLYALGIKPEFRKRGLAEELIRHQLHLAMSQGATGAFLQTEGGSYNEKLFSSFGFRTQAVYDGYVLRP